MLHTNYELKVGWLVVFNVGLELRTGLLPTVWESTRRLIRRQLVSQFWSLQNFFGLKLTWHETSSGKTGKRRMWRNWCNMVTYYCLMKVGLCFFDPIKLLWMSSFHFIQNYFLNKIFCFFKIISHYYSTAVCGAFYCTIILLFEHVVSLPCEFLLVIFLFFVLFVTCINL